MISRAQGFPCSVLIDGTAMRSPYLPDPVAVFWGGLFHVGEYEYSKKNTSTQAKK